MKRHNAKAIAAAVAIAAAAATAESKKKAEPKPSLNTSTLYVDVVKNMTKSESSPSVTPPPPKFTILHEDFPALPGTPEDLAVVNLNAGVPDDWTAMISDDEEEDDADDDGAEDNDDDEDDDDDDDDDDEDDDDEDEDDDGDDEDEVQSPTPDSASECPAIDAAANVVPELLTELESSGGGSSQSSPESSDRCDGDDLLLPPAVALVAATSDYVPNFFDSSNNYSIFDQQFLIAGVAQRLWSRQNANAAKTNVGPPPGFENLKFYGRLRTNRMGVPLGGVTFDMAPPAAAPATAANCHKPSSSTGGGMDAIGAYGLAGLADNLKAAQQHPHLLTEIFGHDAAALNVDAHFCACDSNKLHASFAGPLTGGRCAPHEVNYDVPAHYRRAGGQDLAQPKVEEMQSELLFFFFYTYPGDMMQMLAAAELAERGWRFHIYERLWIGPQPDNPHYVRRGYQESGEYNYFNMVHWKIMPRYFELQPEQMERTVTKAELRDQYGYHPQMSVF